MNYPSAGLWFSGICFFTIRSTIHTEVHISCADQPFQGSSSQNPFFSLLNAFGFLGTGVLAALYASMKKEMADSDATIESVSNLNGDLICFIMLLLDAFATSKYSSSFLCLSLQIL